MELSSPGEANLTYMSTEQGSDPVGDFQRWLMRAGARSIGRDVAGRVRSTLGVGSGNTGAKADVWDTATTEEPPQEAPECQWCPICRAARKYRETDGRSAAAQFGTGQFTSVGDTLAGLTRDAFSLFDAALRSPQRPAAKTPASNWTTAAPAAEAPGPGVSDDGSVVAGPGVGWPPVVHPQQDDHEAADEHGDREEGGESRDGRPVGGADEQVERPAE